jgi:hypothetical protein
LSIAGLRDSVLASIKLSALSVIFASNKLKAPALAVIQLPNGCLER